MAGGYSDQWEFPNDDRELDQPNSIAPTTLPTAQTIDSTPLPKFLHAQEQDTLPYPAPNKIYYFKSNRLATISRLHAHINKDRATRLHSLLKATDLLSSLHVEESRPATLEELTQYHADTQYLTALANYHLFSLRQLSRYGLVDDCAPYPSMFEHACISAGGSIQAATALAEQRCKVAIHLDGGGRHHALKAKASGFCYINDVVLAILRLLNTFKRVLYLDIDVHHGDAVEDAFKSTDRVLTVSLHHSSLGYFPGTGGTLTRINNSSSNHTTAGEGFALNLPLKEGLKDGLFIQAFQKVCTSCFELYKPECIVLVSGVDGLANDPIGRAWSLTPAAYYAAAAHVATLGVPVLMLGGGGYDSAASCCAFTAALAGVTGQILPEDVPQHQFFDRYGPSYSILQPGRPSLAPDFNKEAEVEAMCDELARVLKYAVEKKQRASLEQQNKASGVDGGGARRVVQAKRMKLAAHQ
jgi:acetoin utilization deacetylase AcuC-like enzyme